MHSFFIGRFQPFHDGHKAIIDQLLEEGNNVVVAIRDTSLSKDNPHTVSERKTMIRKLYGDGVKMIVIPDISEVCYGRKVGYKLRRVKLGRKIEEISATKIRNSRKKIIWLTGNVGTGKTALGYLLKERLSAPVLDGDEMRASISLGAGFSKRDREEHNLRVARLAKVLRNQGNHVVVSVIAPFQSTRDKIEKIINPIWVYIKGPKLGKDKPYEPPENPRVVIDPSRESLTDSLEKILKKVRG